MKALKQFSIPFTGLKLGKHNFEFEIDNSFFDAFEHSLVKEGTLKAEVELDRQESMLILNFKVKGTIKLNCDKCLANFDQEIKLEERQLVKFAEDAEEDIEELEILILPRKETAIDVSELIYEFITVAVPFINKCEQVNKTCDEQMLNTLEKLTAGNEEKEVEQNDDPRWEALKKLK